MKRKSLQLKRALRSVLLVLLLSAAGMGKMYAYDFSAVCETGQSLHYEITNATDFYVNTVREDRNLEVNFDGGSTIADPPTQTHWTYNADATYCMTLTGVLYLDGESMQNNPRSEYLEIGAFCGYECRGSCLATFNPAPFAQGYFYLMMLYSDVQSDETITFRIWDHEANAYLDVICTSNITFVADDGLGNLMFPYALTFTTNGGTTPTSFTISATTEPAEGGVVSGAGTYTVGDDCTLLASANFGYSFVNWTEDGQVISSDAEYTFMVTGDRNLIAKFSSNNAIVFVDDNVKAICVANWDTDGDGELSYDEAAAVTDLGQVFRGNTTITSFEELQYFMGLTTISDYAFYNCSNLSGSLYIPNSVTSIGTSAFGFCYGLTSMIIPNSVTSIGYDLFYRCSSLAQIVVETGNAIYDSRENCNAIINTSTNKLVVGCKNTIIPNTVTSIGNRAFGGCIGLTSLNIPNSVTSIGSDAFAYCNNLISIVIPNSVSYIGDLAFVGCSGFQQIVVESGNTVYDSRENCNAIINTNSNELMVGCMNTFIPNTVTTIDYYAFSYCTGLTTIIIPDSVTTIGSYAFEGCSGLTSMTVLSETPPALGYHVFYDTNTSIPVYVVCSSISVYQSAGGWNEFTNYLPATECDSGVITIAVNPTEGGIVTGAGYYEGSTICTLTAMPNEGYLFLHWIKNGEIVSTDSSYSFIVTGDADFVANFAEEGDLCTITFDLFDSYGDGYTGNYLVVTDENGISQQLTIVSGSSAVYTIPFLTGSHITLTWILGSDPEDCSFSVSYSNGNVICHGENLNSSFSYGFNVDCSSAPIENIIFADANVKAICVANWDTNEDGELSYAEAAAVTDLGQVFRENTEITSFEELQYFTGLTTISDYAFYGCSNLSGSLYIPNSVTTIGESAFYNCSGLWGSLTISNSVTIIGNHAFDGCSGFWGYLTMGNSVTSIGDYAFLNCSGFWGNLTIPNSVTSIGDLAFAGCNSFTGALIIPNTVIEIGLNPFICDGLEQIIVDNNPNYDSRENCNAIIKTETNELVSGCRNTIIPNTVTIIDGYAFLGCTFTGSLIIPNSITTIGEYAFSYSHITGSITIPNSVTEIGDYAFNGCGGFTGDLVIPNSVITIGNSVFSNCYFTGSLVIPNSVTTIGDYAFANCICTGSLTIPNSVTRIGRGAFQYCIGFTGNLTIPNSVTSIGSYAFSDCSGLTSLIIGNSVTYIGDWAFAGCNGLTEVLMFGTIPPYLINNAFDNTNSPIYVPYESLDDYIIAPYFWSSYESRIFPMAYTTIPGYGEGEGNYRFIASPLVENTDPTTVDNMIPAAGTYDLYRFDQSEEAEWQNYKAQTDSFVLENGQGYLYANSEEVNVIFKGEFNEDVSKETGLAYDANADFAGWNLVGNPFPVSAYANRSYYTMNEDGTAVEPNAVSSATPIPACTGIMVMAEAEGETVVFSTEAPEAAPDKGCLQIALSQVVEPVETPVYYGDGPSTGSGTFAIDKAIVSFNANDRLEKFVFNKDNARISIPQGRKELAIACTDKQGEVPLNFKAAKNGQYTINVNPEAVELDYLHLIDNLTGADVDLLAAGPSTGSGAGYTFTAKTTDYASRFRLVFSANETDGPSTGSGTFAFVNNGNIIINGEGVLQIVDVMGRIIVSEDVSGNISTANMIPGVYVLRLINGNDMKTQKIVIE